MVICDEMFIPWVPNTQEHIANILKKLYETQLLGAVICVWKNIMQPWKKNHPFLQKEALLKYESLFKPKSPVRNTLYFSPNNSSLSPDNAGYIAPESIESPWQWQGFLQGHWKQCLEELHHLTQALEKRFHSQPGRGENRTSLHVLATFCICCKVPTLWGSCA